MTPSTTGDGSKARQEPETLSEKREHKGHGRQQDNAESIESRDTTGEFQMSLVDFEHLELMSIQHPGRPWSLSNVEQQHGYLPSKAEDYRLRLRQARAEHPPEPAKEKPLKKQTTAQRLECLDNIADQLLASDVTVTDRIIHLRQAASEMGLKCRDDDLQRKLWEARRRRAGGIQMLGPGMAATVKPETWGWEGIILAEETTLVSAEPKVGKQHF